MSMPPEITTKVIANNTLQTQCVNIGQITNYFRGYQEENKYPISTQNEIITFDYFDPVKLDFIPGRYYNFGYYNFDDTNDFNGNQDPENQKSFTWIHYKPSNNTEYSTSSNIGQIKLGEGYDDLLNGLFINDGTAKLANYFYHNLSDDNISKIKETKNGYADFEFGLCPDAYGRLADYKFTDITSISKKYFVNTGSITIHNYFAVGAWSNDKNENFRFILSFILMNNKDKTDYIVYFSPDKRNERLSALPTPDMVLIPDWNGLTFKKFKFEYKQLPTSGAVEGTLYYYNKDGTTTEIVSGIKPSMEDVDYPYSTQFGTYSSAGQGNIVVKSLNYNAYVTSDYHIILNDNNKIKYTFNSILDYFKERYKFSIDTEEASDHDDIIIDWNWMNKQSRGERLDDLYGITIKDSFFDTTNISSLAYLQNPRKTVKIYALGREKVKELVLANKLVSNINTTGAPSLKRLILSNTNSKLESLDLSENKKLNVLLFNKGDGPVEDKYITIRNLKLPPIDHDMIIDLRGRFWGTKIINFESKSSSKPKVFLGLDDDHTRVVEILILKNISFISKLSDFTEEEHHILNIANISQYMKSTTTPLYELYYPKLKLVDISYSNIISNRKNLETFLSRLPDRTGKENGLIFMYGPKFTVNGIKGNMSDIDTSLENLRKKNWLFYA